MEYILPYQKRSRVQPEVRIVHTFPDKRRFGDKTGFFSGLLAHRLFVNGRFIRVTFNKVRDEALFIGTNHLAFTSHTDRSQDVVARAHDISNSSLVKLRNHFGRSTLQLVLEDDKACKLQVAFSFSTCQLLHFHPAKFALVSGGTGNHAVSLVRIVVQ